MGYQIGGRRPVAMGVLSNSLEPIGIIDRYTSLALRPQFYGLGSFEIIAPATAQLLDLVQEDRIINFMGDGEMAGIIEGYDKSLTSLGTTIRIIGPMLNGLMRRRLAVPSDDPDLLGWDVAEGTAGGIMAHYVRNHAIAPIVSARAIPKLRLMAGIENIGMLTVAKARFEPVSDVLQSLGQYASVGWRIAIVDDSLEFQALPVVDRTAGSDNPLLLSTAFQNITSADAGIDRMDYANAVYALGEGEYENRLYQVYYPGDAPVSGWARCETAADCGNEGSVTRLRELALQKIADLEKTNSLSLRLNSVASDINLGDLVTVSLPEVGALYDLLITEMNVSWQAERTQIEVTLGRPPRTLTAQLQRARRL